MKRKGAALILLYVTGLRVSNLLRFKVKNLNSNKDETTLFLIKKGNKGGPVTLSKKSNPLVKTFTDSFLQIMRFKDQEQYLFTTQSNIDKPINRTSFNSKVNKVLIKAVQPFHHHIRLDTFRTSRITNSFTSIDVVKEIRGHKDIRTTLQYKRRSVSELK